MTYLLLFIVFLVGFYCGMTALAMFVVAKRPEPKPPEPEPVGETFTCLGCGKVSTPERRKLFLTSYWCGECPRPSPAVELAGIHAEILGAAAQIAKP